MFRGTSVTEHPRKFRHGCSAEHPCTEVPRNIRSGSSAELLLISAEIQRNFRGCSVTDDPRIFRARKFHGTSVCGSFTEHPQRMFRGTPLDFHGTPTELQGISADELTRNIPSRISFGSPRISFIRGGNPTEFRWMTTDIRCRVGNI